jgi:hypothetical protein
MDIDSAEVPNDFSSADGGDPTDDILSFDTPTPEAVEVPELEQDIEILDEPVGEDTLVLDDEQLLPIEEPPVGSASLEADEMPADLVLEELQGEEDGESSASSELPEIDLEGIPELETELPVAPDTSSEGRVDDEGSETIDLETLDLGEEPMIIDAVPEQVEELQEAEEVLEEESLPSDKPRSTEARGAKTTEVGVGIAEAEPSDEVDLEALAAEAEELEVDVPSTPVVEDLEIGELESLSDEGIGDESPKKEIEISFEGEDTDTLQKQAPPSSHSEEIPDAEEVTESPPTAAASDGIPDNLKDEIRTVLKYMDHLLEALPDEKIQEFASSDYFVMYKKLFEDLGLGE